MAVNMLDGRTSEPPQALKAAQHRFRPEGNPDSDTSTIPQKLCNLPAVHSVANQVLALAADPDVDIRRLASVMESDPAFAAELLFLANSPLLGLSKKIGTLRHAIGILGLARIKALAVTIAVKAFVSGGGPLVAQCWRHSAACAIVCEELSAMFIGRFDHVHAVPNIGRLGHGYTAGLMHDVGRLGFLKAYPTESGALLNSEYATGDEVLEAERALLHVDHGRAGAWLVRTWVFPEAFSEICEHHHAPLQPFDSPLLQMVKVACRIAHVLGFSAVRFQSDNYKNVLLSLPPNLKAVAKLTEEALKTSIEDRLRMFES